MGSRFQIQTKSRKGGWESGVVLDDLHEAMRKCDKAQGWFTQARVFHTVYNHVVYVA